jgi:GAF domain
MRRFRPFPETTGYWVGFPRTRRSCSVTASGRLGFGLRRCVRVTSPYGAINDPRMMHRGARPNEVANEPDGLRRLGQRSADHRRSSTPTCRAHSRARRRTCSRDRDGRGSGRHQLIARRPRADIRGDADKALALCGGTYGGLQTFDGECFHSAAGRGHPEFIAWRRQYGPIRPAPGSQIARIVGGEDAVQITDVANDEVYRAGAPGRRALVDIGGFRTLLSVALRKDNTLLGVLQIYRQEVRPFSDKQIALLQNFAAQAVIAMENARLITETREALEQQTATAEVLGIINASPGDLAPVFYAILERAMRLCDANFGIFQTYDGEYLRGVVDLLRKSGEFPVSNEELDETATTVYEGI